MEVSLPEPANYKPQILKNQWKDPEVTCRLEMTMHVQVSYYLHHTVSLWDGSAGSLSFTDRRLHHYSSGPVCKPLSAAAHSNVYPQLWDLRASCLHSPQRLERSYWTSIDRSNTRSRSDQDKCQQNICMKVSLVLFFF